MSEQIRYPHAPYCYEQPVASQYGRIEHIGERLVCHLCGRDWLNVGIHAWKTHGLTADEYRAEFGLNRTTPLTARSVSMRLRELGRMNHGSLVSGSRDYMAELNRKAQLVRQVDVRLETRVATLERNQRNGALRRKPTCALGHDRKEMPSGRLPRRGHLWCPQCNASKKRREPVVRERHPRPKSAVGDLCSQGHPWDGWTTGAGALKQRSCRQCNRDRVKVWKAEQRLKRRLVSAAVQDALGGAG